MYILYGIRYQRNQIRTNDQAHAVLIEFMKDHFNFLVPFKSCFENISQFNFNLRNCFSSDGKILNKIVENVQFDLLWTVMAK